MSGYVGAYPIDSLINEEYSYRQYSASFFCEQFDRGGFMRATFFNAISKIFFLAVLTFSFSSTSWAASIFLTGHDPDFHAQGSTENFTGAQHIIQRAIAFVTDASFNPFASTGKFLFVESNGPLPGGHLVGLNGLTASGFTQGVHFDHADASTLNSALNQLGTSYSALVVASDFGGILRQAELDILNARSGDIIDFLNDGGGLFAMAESNSGAHLTPNGGHFGFLPFVTTSTAVDQNEANYTVTPFGLSIGLTDSDVNGNFSHNIFNGDFGLNIVDVDARGRILSLAGRGLVNPDTGVGTTIPEPATILLIGGGLLGLVFQKRKAS
jgi:hypothetical protein